VRDIIPVILCGGVGKRLWPFSTPSRPKPFLKWGGRFSMLQKTLLRVQGCARPVVIANAGLKQTLMRQIDETNIAPQRVILEPVGRNTAPALAASAVLYPDDLLLILPCDHAIRNPEALLQAVRFGKSYAQQGWIVAFGIRPRYAETGFGYIRRGPRMAEGIYKIDRFLEKPNKDVARSLVRGGTCDWNSGIFLLSGRTALTELERFEPGLLRIVREATQGIDGSDALLLASGFASAPKLSIDIALMERSDKTLVIPVDLDWNDLGTFKTLFQALCRSVFG